MANPVRQWIPYPTLLNPKFLGLPYPIGNSGSGNGHFLHLNLTGWVRVIPYLIVFFFFFFNFKKKNLIIIIIIIRTTISIFLHNELTKSRLVWQKSILANYDTFSKVIYQKMILFQKLVGL